MKSLYSLKQSAQVWNYMLQNHVIVNGFEQLYSDYGLYYNSLVFIVIYVNNLALTSLWDI